MGGAAYIIEGTISSRRLKPIRLKRGLLDKILMRHRQSSPRRLDIGDREMIDIPCSEIKILEGRFRGFIKERIPSPSSATTTFLAYLDLEVISIYVRKEQSKERGGERCYVQFSFSGCAGVGEISAKLGCHWVNVWYSDSKAAIDREYLQPFGFTPNGNLTREPAHIFLPLHDIGYAAYLDTSFEVDAGICETESGEQVIHELNQRFTVLMKEGKCRCQLCAPEFTPIKVESL